MRVTVVDCDLSYPPTSGKRLRTLHLMLPLASRHRITYLGRSDGDREVERRASEFLRDHGIEPIFVRHAVPAKSGLSFYARLGASCLARVPYAVAAHNSRRVFRAIRNQADQRRTDLWQFEWLPYVAALPRPADHCALLNAQNVDSRVWRRYVETARSPWHRWFARQQWRKQERLERALLPRYRGLVAVSDDDARAFREQFGCRDVTVVDNGIDAAHFQAVQSAPEPRRILFLGLLNYRPNCEAVELLLNEIFPRVLAAEPAARLAVVGRDPPAHLARRVARTPRVELHADVADVRSYLSTSGVMTVPLRVGGGSRLKILEAIASGLPVVSTALGAEGLKLGREHGVRIVGDVAQMAQALVECIRAPAALREAAQHGRRIVLERHAWTTLADRLEAAWQRCWNGTAGVGL